MTFSERLAAAMAKTGHTQKSLAEAVGMAQSSVWKLLSGAKGSRKTVAIAKELGVNPDWLANGTGMMTKEPATNVQLARRESNIGDESQWSEVSPWDKSTPLDTDEVEVPFLKDIEFACGDGKIADEDHNGFKIRFSKATLRRVGADSNGQGVICFPATGDSMEPIIPGGTTVAVDTSNKRIVDGKIYAISQDGAGTDKLKRIKQLYRKPGGKLIVRSFNVPEDEIYDESEVEIIGRVFWYSVLL